MVQLRYGLVVVAIPEHTGLQQLVDRIQPVLQVQGMSTRVHIGTLKKQWVHSMDLSGLQLQVQTGLHLIGMPVPLLVVLLMPYGSVERQVHYSTRSSIFTAKPLDGMDLYGHHIQLGVFK
jgi:hypothetical protein